MLILKNYKGDSFVSSLDNRPDMASFGLHPFLIKNEYNIITYLCCFMDIKRFIKISF